MDTFSGPGIKTVYVKIFDNIGNYAVTSDTIILVPNIAINNSGPGFRLRHISFKYGYYNRNGIRLLKSFDKLYYFLRWINGTFYRYS